MILIELTEKRKFKGQEYSLPAIAAVHLNFNRKTKELDLNTTSVHGRTSEFIVDNLSSNLLMYLNREKCHQLLQTYFTPSVVRRMYPDNDRHKRLQMIREMCNPQIHKDRSLNTGVTTMEARCYFKDSGHLYVTNNTQRPTLMQAIKQKISPKPKRTIPTPTGYKTEEDLRQFREELTLNRPLNQDEAYQQSIQMYAEFIPNDSPAYNDIEKSIKQHIDNTYQQGKVLTPKNIQQDREQMEKKTMPQVRQDFHQAALIEQQKVKADNLQQNRQQNTQQQQKQEPQEIQDLNQNKGGRSR